MLRDESPPAASQLLLLTEHINRLEGHMKELEQHQQGLATEPCIKGIKHDNQQSESKTGNSCWVKFSIVVWFLIGIILILVNIVPKDMATLTMILASISTFFIIWLFKLSNINITLLILYGYCTAHLQYNYRLRGANTKT